MAEASLSLPADRGGDECASAGGHGFCSQHGMELRLYLARPGLILRLRSLGLAVPMRAAPVFKYGGGSGRQRRSLPELAEWQRAFGKYADGQLEAYLESSCLRAICGMEEEDSLSCPLRISKNGGGKGG